MVLLQMAEFEYLQPLLRVSTQSVCCLAAAKLGLSSLQSVPHYCGQENGHKCEKTWAGCECEGAVVSTQMMSYLATFSNGKPHGVGFDGLK